MTSAELDPLQSISDQDGLDEAYQDQKSVYMEGGSLFMAGTSSLGEVADELALPFGLTRGPKSTSMPRGCCRPTPGSHSW